MRLFLVKKKLIGLRIYSVLPNFATLAIPIHKNKSSMKKHALLLTVLILFVSLPAFAQENTAQSPRNTLDNQMVEVFEKSNSYQQYKVIEKAKLAILRKNILDSISNLETTITQQETNLVAQEQTIDSLNLQLTSTQEELEATKEQVENIDVLGIATSKGTYNTIMWSVIGILLLVGAIFVYRFSTSHSIIKEANEKIDELNTENEELRRSHLEREQVLRRKLQDEINKNRKKQ